MMLDALRQVPLFAQLSDEQLHWLSEQGTEVWLQPGEIHREQGDPADYVFVLLEGEVQVTEKVGDRELVLVTYRAKTLFGELPILLGIPYYWAAGRALTECHILELRKDAFWDMLAKIPAVATAILRTMAERMQELQSVSQQREKLIELGTIAAGLAQQLSHPAAVLERDARQLDQVFEQLPSVALNLNQQPMTAQRLFLAELQRDVTERQSDRDEIAAHLPTDSLPDVLSTGVKLLSEIEQNSAQLSQLVKAIKEYSYMDQAPLQEVDVHEGLENTLTILQHKIKGDVIVTREYDRNLPRISAYGSELNQVWTNLIDNAIDAIGGKGQIWLRTWREQNQVFVEIADDGTGIPPEIQHRIFELFFTTKGVGQGNGLGLVTSYRTIVGKHHGDISVSSQPGNTRFQVRLPINQV